MPSCACTSRSHSGILRRGSGVRTTRNGYPCRRRGCFHHWILRIQNPHAPWWMLAACLSIGSSMRRRAGSSTPRMRPATRAAAPRDAALRLSGVQRHVARGVLIEWVGVLLVCSLL
ncbi:hypothetical protein BS78_06G018200 [Paspalum vaginatum]|nr:hypothetical protein BS78_06G018200 [Paspalum vaginatum]